MVGYTGRDGLGWDIVMTKFVYIMIVCMYVVAQPCNVYFDVLIHFLFLYPVVSNSYAHPKNAVKCPLPLKLSEANFSPEKLLISIFLLS